MRKRDEWLVLAAAIWIGGSCSSGDGGEGPAIAPVGGGMAGSSAPAPNMNPMQNPVGPTAPTAGSASTPPPPPPSMAQGGSSAQPPATGNMPMTLDPRTPYAMVPASCRGLELEGLKYSPGGNVLPNKCAPFDSAFNNPYAIRCIDADPSYDTGYLGDEWCVLPPAPENGTQIRVGPESYASPSAGFVLEPGEEITNYYFVNAPNTEQHYYYRTNWRMRNGSHHMIITVMNDRADGWSASGDIGAGGSRSFGGAQRPNQDRPSGTLEISPENADLGERLDPKQQFSFNLHHFNLTDEPTLREVWVNVWYKPQSEVKREIDGISIFGNPLDLNIPNGEHRVLHYRCDVPGNTRIMTLNGHRHAWTDRFGVWLIRSGSTEEIPIYESFDYNDMPTYQYDSVTQNPVPDRANQIDGAFSGVLDVKRGDQLHFVCDITNGSGGSLRFANEVMTGEMCILFGSRTGDALCSNGTRVQGN